VAHRLPPADRSVALVPADLFAAASIAAANLTIWLDARVDAPIRVRPFLASDPATAATFAGAIAAAATLAFVAVVFATTLVAIQLAASQYSPRAASATAGPRASSRPPTCTVWSNRAGGTGAGSSLPSVRVST
jgi:uncharacterized membrane protein